MSDYITTTLAEKLNVVRYYETSLYYIAEYKAGGHSRGLSNYLFHDKKTTKLYQVTNKFDYETSMHFSISAYSMIMTVVLLLLHPHNREIT